MIDLKPCPFCNEEANIIEYQDMNEELMFYPECSICNCGWKTMYETIPEAIEAWNKRTESKNE